MFSSETTKDAYWVHPEKRLISESSEQEIHTAVGRALSEWEHVEVAITWLYHHFIESGSGAAMHAASEVGTSARKKLLKAAGEYFLKASAAPPMYGKQLKDICAAYEKGAYKRNDIAHAYVEEFVAQDEVFGFFLVPPFYAFHKTRKGNVDPMTAYGTMIKPLSYAFVKEDIIAYADKFRAFRVALIAYMNEVHKELWLPRFKVASAPPTRDA